MNQEEPAEQEAVNLEESVDKDIEGSGGKRFGNLSQSRSAILTVFIIILILDLLAILFATLEGEAQEIQVFRSTFQLILSIVIDLFLGINLLRGKGWARTWMLIRLAGGIVIFGIVFAIQSDYISLLLNTGVLLALIILLTGTSTRLRIAGSIALAVVVTLGGIIWAVMAPFMAEFTLPTVPETPTPNYYLTYTSEGFYSISYPPDWEPEMSIIEDAEKDIKNWAKGEGLESQISEMQLVFTGWKMTEDGDPPFVMVQVIPRGLWPLDTLVEADRQLSIETIGQYLEYSMVRTTIGGREAIVLNWQGRFPESTSLTRGTTAYIAGEEFLWAVSCACDNQDSDTYLDTFDNIVRSLRVEY